MRTSTAPVTIVDYGMGNLGSVRNMFRYLGVEARLTRDPCDVAGAEKLLLPGVGAFDAAMRRIDDGGFREALERRVQEDGVPILGICLGMQLLTRGSDEGERSGLGWIDARAHRFPPSAGLKVPHMGWNVAVPTRPSPLTADLPDEARFYFVHSYYVRVEDEDDSLLKTTYGVTFDSAIRNGNIYGAQFHPEKSHRFGMTILANFAAL